MSQKDQDTRHGEEFTEGNTSKKQAKKSSAKEKKFPKKVLTPGSNFLEPSESSEEEEESDNREEAQTDDAEERDVNLGFLADTSTVIECNSA